MIQISGTVETIIYKNEETGFTVLELDHDASRSPSSGSCPRWARARC